jgi:hypothetical protein
MHSENNLQLNFYYSRVRVSALREEISDDGFKEQATQETTLLR